ncbi:hypothetical protein P154DRAFT_522884 [Amniculicola lignicola CBS 123094]|uniref:C4-dicarboxylate/malic acid transporter n=1 Tax=Amniculicola lignicola CBS 123094 TaxID=1392246 RepID=A0A6A5WGB3_9PLEO|nr:hypothetical protein P154DRAFT_522884 [Amniculicola lignicola CBS 123094]
MEEKDIEMRNRVEDGDCDAKRGIDKDAETGSVNSIDSAEQRLRWRNHEKVFTPSGDAVMIDPFEDVGNVDIGRCDFIPMESVIEGEVEQTSSEEAEEKSGSVGMQDAGVEKINECPEGSGNGRGKRKRRQEKEEEPVRLNFRERIRHFTWTWFTMTMATGGIANVLYTVPFQFGALYALGCTFFILNMVLFVFNIVMISLRFYFYPRTFKASFMHPTESLFIPAAVISFGTILINVSQYGVGHTGFWLEKTMVVLFWVDCGLAIAFSVGIYLIMWSTQHFTIHHMTPVWIFPAYPLLIIGPHASNLAPKLASTDPSKSLSIIITGFVIQGIGFLVSLMIYSTFLYRLMTQKFPKESLRPAMFISVGPSGFTIAGVVGMGQILPHVVPKDFMGEGMGELAGKVSMICANWMGLWLWGLAFWFFFVSVGAHYSCARYGKMDFAMTWYSFVFPNTALTTATFAIAKALGGNRPIQYVGCAMTIGIIVTWFVVFGMMIRAVKKKQILWPHKQEDRTEGGYTQPQIEAQMRRGRADTRGTEDGLNRVWSLRRSVSRRAGKGTKGRRERRLRGSFTSAAGKQK